MEIMPRETIEIGVILYPEGGFWIAQGLEFDITARGDTPTDASERFNAKVGAELVISLEVGDASPLAGVGRAPQKFWDMYDKAKMRLERIEDNEPIALPVTDTEASTPLLKPHLRILDKAA